jgi:sulfate transport system substrate-binding protein
MLNRWLAGVLAGIVCVGASALAQSPVTLLNVSYDPTREFYQDVNAAFAKSWQAKTGQTVTISDRMAAAANRPARSSTVFRLTWSPWRSPTTSTR